MKLGLGSWACAWAAGAGAIDAAGLVERAESLGLKLVQIADNIPLENASDEEIARIDEAVRRTGVEIELGTRGIEPGHLERYLTLCERLSSRLLRVVVDKAGHEPAADEIVARIEGLRSELERTGVVLGIENHDRFQSKTLAQIIERIGSAAVGVCLDTVNSFGALEGPEVVIETLGPHVVNLHLKDFVIEREPHMMGFRITGAPAGRGRLKVPRLLSRLREFRREVNAILELWPAPECDCERTIAKEEDWARESVKYLRTLIAG